MAATARCLGHDLVREREAIKRQTGYMTQHFGLYEDLTIRENLEFVAESTASTDAASGSTSALEQLGLAIAPTAAHRRPVGRLEAAARVGRRVLHEPKLLLLDEPTAGVDPKARRAFWDEIHAMPHRASPCWSRPTTWTRPSAVTRSPTSPTAS